MSLRGCTNNVKPWIHFSSKLIRFSMLIKLIYSWNARKLVFGVILELFLHILRPNITHNLLTQFAQFCHCAQLREERDFLNTHNIQTSVLSGTLAYAGPCYLVLPWKYSSLIHFDLIWSVLISLKKLTNFVLLKQNSVEL